MCHALKFVSFLKKNRDVPFQVKFKIFNAALMSSVLYGCESWLNGDVKPLEKLYNWAVKQLLGVRMTTCTDVGYVELGLPPLKYIIRGKQRTFFQRLWEERQHMVDDPWVHAVKLVLATNTTTCKYIRGLITDKLDDYVIGCNCLKQSIRDSTSSRRVTYRQLNPDLTVDVCYLKGETVKENYRIAYSQFRLSGHKLYSIRVREVEGTGEVADAYRLRNVCALAGASKQNYMYMYVLESCPLTGDIRARYSFTSWSQMLLHMRDQFDVPQIVYNVLSYFT